MFIMFKADVKKQQQMSIGQNSIWLVFSNNWQINHDSVKTLNLLWESLFTFTAVNEDDAPGLRVLIKELDDVLLRDVGNKIQDSGK